MIALLNQMALDAIGVPRNVAYVTAREAARTRTDLQALPERVQYCYSRSCAQRRLYPSKHDAYWNGIDEYESEE